MSLTHKLFRPVDNSPLILFRIIFGALIFLEAWGAILTGWVKRAFIDPDYTFPFIELSWLQPLPGNAMYIYYFIMGLAGLMVMAGFYYRLGIGIYTLLWSGVYFMQKTHYNNHYYLLVLLCLLMCLVPANRYAALDIKRNPHLKRLTCPQWCLWIFALQVTIVYCYAALAKMYPDWLNAEPIGVWFKAKSDYWIIGPLLQEKWFQYAVAYGGIAFDLLIVPGLLLKKTRVFAFSAAVFFHLFNSAVFHIGVFPYMGIALSVFFFEPEKIRRMFFRKKEKAQRLKYFKYRPVLIYALAGFFLIQVLLPIRHWFFPGNVNWTEEGHRMSWRMMLRVKTGYVSFNIFDPGTGEAWKIDPDVYLTRKQSRAIAVRPDMCWQFVQILKEDFKQKGYPDVEIYANGKVRLNKRTPQALYDVKSNLAAVPWRPLQHAKWLVPLKEED